MQGAEDLRERMNRVDRHAAVNSRVQIPIGAGERTSSLTIPRSAVVIAGVERSHIPVSQTSAISAFSVFEFLARKAGSEGDPVSSSPSNSAVIWHGGPPNCLKARQASKRS